MNEFNELFGSGKNEYGELGLGHLNFVENFTKIITNNINDIIEFIYENNNYCFPFNLIITKSKDIYITGYNNELEIKDCKSFTKTIKTPVPFCGRVKTETKIYYYFDKFTKINTFKTSKFIFPLFFRGDIFVIETDNENLFWIKKKIIFYKIIVI